MNCTESSFTGGDGAGRLSPTAGAEQTDAGQTGAELETGRALLQAMLDNSPDLIQVFAAVRDETGAIVDFTWVLTNHAAQRIYGDMIGQRLLTCNPGIVPAGTFDTFKRVVETGEPDQSAHHVAHTVRNGRFLQSTVKLGDGVATTTADITARVADVTAREEAACCLHADEEQQAFLLKLSDAVRPLGDPVEIMATVSEMVGRHFQVGRCGYAEVSPPYDHLVARDWTNGVMQSLQGAWPLASFGETVIAQYRTGQTVVYEDVFDDDQLRGGYEAGAVAAGSVRSSISVQLIKGGEWVACFYVQETVARHWTQHEIELMEEIAERTWAALERGKAENALQKSEEKYRTLFNSIDEGFYSIELIYNEAGEAVDYCFLEANPVFERQTGLENVVGRLGSEVSPNTESYWLEAYDDVVRTGEPQRIENYSADTARWYSAYASRVGGAGSRQVAVVCDDITVRKRQEEALQKSEANLTAELANTRQLQLISSQLILEDDVQTLYAQILDAAIGLMGADAGSLQIFSAAENELQLLAWRGFHPNSARFWETVRLDSASSCGEALKHNARVIVPDIETCEFMADTQDLAAYRQSGLQAIQSTPLVARDGRCLGMLSTHWQEIHAPSERDLRFLDVLARQAADLMERARAEAALRASEEKYRALFEKMEDGFGIAEIIVDDSGRPVDYRMIEINPQFERLTGQSREEFLQGRTVREVAPELEEEWYDFYGQVGVTGRSAHREIHAAAWDRWFEVTAYRIGEPAQRRVAILYGEITERKRVEIALRQSEARIRIALDAAQMATWEWHLHTDEIYWNDQHFLLFGMTPRSTPMHPSDFFEHVHPDDQGWLAERLQTVVEECGVFDAEFRCVTEAGDERWMSGYGRVMTEMDGQAAHMSGVMYDITERKAAEAALRESKERFRAVANLVPDLLWSNDPAAGTSWYNQRWLDYTGQTLAEARQQGWMAAIHVDDRAGALNHLQRTIAQGMPLRQEQRLRRADGAYRWFLVQVHPVVDDTGQLVRWFGAATDIHEQRMTRNTLERHVQERTRELATVSATRQNLLERLITAQEDERRRIAHDLHDSLGQHLVALNVGLKTVQELDDFPLDVATRIGALRAMVVRMDEEVERLAFALRPSALDDLGLPDALRRHVQAWAADSRIAVDIHVHGLTERRLPTVVETAIFRVVQEALTNIRRHAQATHVSLLLEQRPGEIQTIIEDNGRGFDVATVQAMSNTRTHLGLNGMRERAALVGGQLEVESTPGAGTTLYLHVPLTEHLEKADHHE